MARRPSTPSPPERPVLTIEQKRRAIMRIQQRVQELEAFDPDTAGQRFKSTVVSGLETAIDEVLSKTFGHGTIDYRRYDRATKLDHGPVFMSFGHGDEDPEEERRKVSQYLSEGKHEAITLLTRTAAFLQEEIEDASPTEAVPKASSNNSQKVFVVHGHDEAVLENVARWLERIGLEAIILREQPDRGLTIIEKFESCASEVGFAVVLLTPDDTGGSAKSAEVASRVRQNVIFELGYFARKLGRGRSCLLRKGDVEIPSDLYGVIYTDLDPNNGWRLNLARELDAAGLQFDANKVW